MTTMFSFPLITCIGFLFIIKVIHAHFRQFGNCRKVEKECQLSIIFLPTDDHFDPFHCSARRPWERTTYVGYPEPSLWVFLCALTTESFLGRWRLFYWSCKWLYLPIKVKSCSFTEWPACSDCQLHILLLKTSHFLVPPYHAFCKLLLTRIKSHLNLLSRIPTLSTLLQCS